MLTKNQIIHNKKSSQLSVILTSTLIKQFGFKISSLATSTKLANNHQ